MYLIRERLSFLKGKRVIEATGNTREDKSRLVGKEILDVKSLGKRLVIEFDDFYLVIHFLMYGSLRINEKAKDKKERLSLKFSDCVVNFYNTSLKIVEKSAFSMDDGIDIMSENFDSCRAKNAIRSYNGFICDLLLDQKVFAGVGNIIKNEALFRARIHPLSISKNIDEEYVERLIMEVIKFAREFYLSRKKGESLKPKLLIYGKKNCPACSGKVKIKYLGKTNRRTYFCEACQRKF